MTGMVSCRHNGASIAELSGIYINKNIKYIIRIISIILLILVGTVFVTSPAALLAELSPKSLNIEFWIIMIFIYYVLATILPFDKIIGKLYPVFGIFLLLMAVLILGGIIFNKALIIPELTLKNCHPDGLSAWPFMFITVACGAIS